MGSPMMTGDPGGELINSEANVWWLPDWGNAQQRAGRTQPRQEWKWQHQIRWLEGRNFGEASIK